MLTRWAGWFFRDPASARIVIGQFPNLPLWLFGAAWILSRIASGDVARWAFVASRLCLAVWAADELLRGVNPWRRCLGLGVLAWMGMSLIV